MQSYGLWKAPANPFPNYLLFWKPFPIFLVFLETHGHPTPTKARNVSGHSPDLSADKAPLTDYSQANLTQQKG